METKNSKTIPILIADDDEEDLMLLQDAMEESRLKKPAS